MLVRMIVDVFHPSLQSMKMVIFVLQIPLKVVYGVQELTLLMLEVTNVIHQLIPVIKPLLPQSFHAELQIV